MKSMDFQAPLLFSSTFKALNLGEKIQVLSRTFRMRGNPIITTMMTTTTTTTTTTTNTIPVV